MEDWKIKVFYVVKNLLGCKVYVQSLFFAKLLNDERCFLASTHLRNKTWIKIAVCCCSVVEQTQRKHSE